tara:strand:+ start:2524 stop:3291 length:768 start_codon:yes stop_codon:yes gene_type:complete
MGYDLEIITKKTKRKYQMWFSVWDWYRLLVITLHGLGALTSEEVERKLMTVNGLQQGTLPDDEDQEEIDKIIEIDMEDGDEKDVIKTRVLEMNIDADVKGRIRGVGIAVPRFMTENASEEELEKIYKHLESLATIQLLTNHMLFDTQSATGFGNKTCKALTCNDGMMISQQVVSALGCGMFIAVSKADALDPKLEESFNEVSLSDSFEAVLSELHRMDAGDFEMDELWENHQEETRKWFAIMIKATMLDAKIKIT